MEVNYNKSEYIYISKFLDIDNINQIIKYSQYKQENDSKVGNRVCFEKKIRKDIFFNEFESKKIDDMILNKINDIVKLNFNIDIKTRETYKIGTYYGETNGYYIPHTDTQGGKDNRQISMILCLSNCDDYEGGILNLINLDKKFKLDMGDIVLFRSEQLHSVDKVISGKRQVLISFMWNDKPYTNLNLLNDNLITYIPPDSGPGNQIVSLKETLIISILLNRKCIIMPIREHYLKSNNIFYNFNDIFKLNLDNIILDNNQLHFFNNIDNNKRYVLHPNYFNKYLRHEKLINSKNNIEVLLNNRRIKNNNDLNEIKNINDNVIILKHVFNNICIHNNGINGDYSSQLNTYFLPIYKNICSNWDFSDYIKINGDKFINNFFKNLDYISIHIRLPDIIKNKLDNSINNKIIENFLKLKKENNLIFIASNNINYLKQIGINEIYININDKYNSFIEQYICCMSKKFFYLNFDPYNINNRSTWTSFVIDYRLFFRKLETNYNLKTY